MRLSARFFFIFFTVFPFLTESGTGQNVTDLFDEVEIFDKFGTLNRQDLQTEADHNFPYEFILKESTVRMVEEGRSLTAYIDYLIRIKVYSDDPIQRAQASLVGIPYYFADGIERVQHIEGITYQPDGQVSILQQNQLRFIDLNPRYRLIEFEMPDVQQGSVIEYKYRLERRYIEELPDFYFSERVPTRKAVLNFKNSNLIRYDVIRENIDFEIQYIEQRVDTSSVPLIFTYHRPEPLLLQRWSAENIPPVDVDSYVSSADDIRGQLKFQISEFGIPRQPLENSWEFVTAQILRNNNPFELIDYYPQLKQTGAQISENLSDQEEIQDSIFSYVNSRVQFNGQNAVFADRGLTRVLDGEPANQAEINLTLLAMLRGAGLEAYPVYISGREFGRINRDFPSLFQFNRVLIASLIDGKYHIMDASYPHSLPNLITVDSNNGPGMVLKEKDHQWADIDPVLSRFVLDIRMDAELNERGDLRGTLTAVTQGYPSQMIRENRHRGASLEQIISEIFFDVYPGIVLSNNRIDEDPENPDKVYVNTDFLIPRYSVTFSEGIEFHPMIVGYLYDNPFEPEERRVPITLDAPELLTIRYQIELPEGYSFDVSGETRNSSLPGASLFEEYFVEGNRLEYGFDIEISKKEFPSENYSELRRIYERWVQLSRETWYIETE